ncbi:hypothetical protein HNR59_001244 [Aquamicrobium lusatiense]|uniref:Helix-turn-helix domain-containing protein n=1 Tax=Aquamicrobium lusatiense TaxID=89772 RepID=A0A7W9VTL2_9HYPH|nr:hypothetical protein [Aquamicrobium lusatiense]MBB6011899.1 hypothetical protein [Aquamicrobium lusatiense]
MTAARQIKSSNVLTGKRKSHQQRRAVPLQWPKEKKEKLALFDAWHDVAMQIVHLENDDFRLLAAVRKVLMFSSGEIIASNREIAWRAGHCSDKTITRCIKRYADLGILIVASGWRRDGDNLFKTRTIRLALPETLDDRVEVVDLRPFGLDTRGPGLKDTRGPDPYGHPWSRPASELKDTRGPGLKDTRGPISRDTRKEEGRREIGANGTVELFSETEEG